MTITESITMIFKHNRVEARREKESGEERNIVYGATVEYNLI